MRRGTSLTGVHGDTRYTRWDLMPLMQMLRYWCVSSQFDVQ